MSETPMRERVARVLPIFEQERCHYLPKNGFPCKPICFCGNTADAVLAAMEEPTEAMVAAAEACFFEHMPEARDWTVTMARQALRAAILAAREGK